MDFGETSGQLLCWTVQPKCDYLLKCGKMLFLDNYYSLIERLAVVLRSLNAIKDILVLLVHKGVSI
jgi:hypothetical protein